MHFLRRYYIFDYDISLKERLDEFGLHYSEAISPLSNTSSLSFAIDESKAYFNLIEPHLPKTRELDYSLGIDLLYDLDSKSEKGTENKADVILTFEPVYSKEETDSAPWFIIEPLKITEIKNKDWTEIFRGECETEDSRGKKRFIHIHRTDGAYKLTKPFKWGTRFFSRSITSSNSIFLNDAAKEVLEAGELKGLGFLSLVHPKTADIIKNIHELRVPYELSDKAIKRTEFFHEMKCPVCERTVYRSEGGRSSYFLDKEYIDDSLDFIKTPPVISRNGIGIGCQAEILVSPKVYRLLRENKMHKGIIFTPVWYG